MHENDLAKIIVHCAFKVHSHLGPGLLESVYESALAHELQAQGLEVRRQVPIPISYDNLIFDEGFRADIIVDDLVIVEIKSIEEFARVHFKQLLTYLRLSNKRLGLLINFNEALFKNGVRRVVNRLT